MSSPPARRIVYTADSPLCDPGGFARAAAADLRAAPALARRLLSRNLRSQYRQSLLGYVWAVLPPVVTMLAWVLLRSAGLVNAGEIEMPYPLYVLTGSTLWQLFVDMLNAPLNQMWSARSMLRKASFPREALVLAGAGEVLFNFLVRLAVLGLAFAVLRAPLPSSLPLAAVGVGMLSALGLGLGLLLVPAGMFFHDVQRALGVLTTLWFFVTPVVYALPQGTAAAQILRLNPVTPLLVATRAWLAHGAAPSTGGFVLVSAASVLLLVAAWLLVRVAMPHIVARLGSN